MFRARIARGMRHPHAEHTTVRGIHLQFFSRWSCALVVSVGALACRGDPPAAPMVPVTPPPPPVIETRVFAATSSGITAVRPDGTGSAMVTPTTYGASAIGAPP